MRRFFFVFLGYLALASFPSYADEIKTGAELKAATVFLDRAMLTREAVVEVQAGKHTIVIEDLPSNLYPDSLRVEGAGTARAVFGALSHKIVNNAEFVSSREKTLNDQIKDLENQRRVIQAEKTALAAKRKFLESLEARAADKSKEEIAEFNLNTEQWLGAAGTIVTGVNETLKEDIQKDIQIETLDKQITKIRQDLNQLRTGRKSSYEVRLPVEAQSEGNLTISLSYLMPGASWRPVYDARLETGSGNLEITQYGSVTQGTGEDWKDISLTLSTAQPQRGAQAPSLSPMWVNLIQKGNYYNSGAAALKSVQFRLADGAGADASYAEAVEENAARRTGGSAWPVPIEQSRAQINTGGFTAEYVIPGPANVPADGTESKHLIGPFETENKMEVHIKPQRSSHAYLIAKTTLKGDAPILPGQVSLFLDGSFVGKISIPMLRPGKDYDLSFGIDDQIEVQHKTLKDEQSESGIIIAKSKVIERRYITEIQNLRKKNVDIVLLQTLPASKNEDIKTTLLPEHTSPGFKEDHDNLKGLTSWSFALKPQEKKDIKFGWRVSWPEDQNITGLY